MGSSEDFKAKNVEDIMFVIKADIQDNIIKCASQVCISQSCSKYDKCKTYYAKLKEQKKDKMLKEYK